MEQGLRQWFHRNDRSGTSRGGLEAVEGAGVNNSTALNGRMFGMTILS